MPLSFAAPPLPLVAGAPAELEPVPPPPDAGWLPVSFDALFAPSTPPVFAPLLAGPAMPPDPPAATAGWIALPEVDMSPDAFLSGDPSHALQTSTASTINIA
jgi:hypothetical protein